MKLFRFSDITEQRQYGVSSCRGVTGVPFFPCRSTDNDFVFCLKFNNIKSPPDRRRTEELSLIDNIDYIEIG